MITALLNFLQPALTPVVVCTPSAPFAPSEFTLSHMLSSLSSLAPSEFAFASSAAMSDQNSPLSGSAAGASGSTRAGLLAVGQPLYAPIAHPELRQLGLRQITRFLQEREKYVSQVSAARAAGASIQPVPLTSSVDSQLLRSLVGIGVLKGAAQVADVTDDMLKEYLERSLGAVAEHLSAENLDKLVKRSVHFNTRELDPSLRATRLITDYMTFLQARKMEDLTTKNPQLAASHICSLLQPPALRERITAEVTVENPELGKNWPSFVNYVIDKAVALDEFFPISRQSPPSFTVASAQPAVQGTGRLPAPRPFYRHRSWSRHRQEGRLNSRGSGTAAYRPGARPIEPYARKRGNAEPQTSVAKRVALPSPLKTPSEPGNVPSGSRLFDGGLPRCLNSRCKEFHYVRDCPVTTPDERRSLLNAFYRRRDSGRKRLSSVRSSAAVKLPSPSSGRFAGKLAGVVDVVVNGDYGADHSALSERHIKACRDAGIDVAVTQLAKPVRMLLAIGGLPVEKTEEYVAPRRARVTTVVNVSTGPLRLRNVEYLVFENDMPEVLLSRPLLQTVGFHLDKHLSAVREQVNDADFSHICFEPGVLRRQPLPVEPSSLARRLLDTSGRRPQPAVPLSSVVLPPSAAASQPPATRVSSSVTSPATLRQFSVVRPDVQAAAAVPSPLFYGDGPEDDPLRQDNEVPAGEDEPAETMRQLLARFDEAVAQGLPRELHDELRSLLQEFADVFRTKLGADPPVSVPPMRIVLKDGARPVRVRLRRYSPPQAAFLRKKTDELLALGLVRRNNSSQWACAPLIVPKPVSEKFRFTVDLRSVNKQTVPHPWPMPHLETALAELSGASCFASIDRCHGYWRMPLDESSQEC